MDRETKWAILVTIFVEVIFWALLLFFVIWGIGEDLTTSGFTWFLPNGLTEVILFMGLMPLYTIILAFVAVALSGGFYSVVKALLKTRGSYVYARIQVKRQVGLWNNFRNSLYPALWAVSIAIILTDYNSLFTFIFKPGLTAATLGATGNFMFITSFLALPFCTLPFLVFWALNDSGIYITTKTKDGETELIMERVGDHFLRLLEGFAGIAVFVSYGMQLFKFIVLYGFDIVRLPSLSFGVAIPFILSMFVLPAAILCERWMFTERHSLKPTLSKLTDVTDEIDDLEQKYRERLGDLERKLSR